MKNALLHDHNVSRRRVRLLKRVLSRSHCYYFYLYIEEHTVALAMGVICFIWVFLIGAGGRSGWFIDQSAGCIHSGTSLLMRLN